MSQMLSLVKLKKYYEDMYSELRHYIWDFHTVEKLAELEIATYRRFPDPTELRNKFNLLYSCIYRTCLDDENLNETVLAFKKMINSSDNYFSKIDVAKEV